MLCHAMGEEGSAPQDAKEDEPLEKDQQNFPCNQCEKIFSKLSFMLKHRRYEHSGEKIKCPQCDYATRKDYHMKNHMMKHSNETTPPESCQKIYECIHCENRCETKQGLKKHIDNIHLGIKFQCSQCEFLGYEIRKHMLIHSDGKHVCDICGHKSREPKDLRYHMLSQHSGKNRIRQRRKAKESCNVLKQDSFCTLCEFKCKDKNYLKQHVLTVHEGKRYACDKCDYSAKYPANLNKHKTMVHQGREESAETFKKRNIEKVGANYESAPSELFSDIKTDIEMKYSVAHETGHEIREEKVENPKTIVVQSGELEKSLLQEWQVVEFGELEKSSLPELEQEKRPLLELQIKSKNDGTMSEGDVACKEEWTGDDSKITPVTVEVKSGVRSVRQFNCEQCDSNFLNMKGLKSHMDSMHNEVESACSKCSFMGTRAQLNYHFFEHNPNICDECGITVPGPPATLKYHILRNHSKSIKQCKLCTFKGTFSKFKYHTMFEHQNPQACVQCGMKLKHEKALQYHMKSKHPEVKTQLRKRKTVEEGAIAKWLEKKPNVILKPKVSDTVVQIKISSKTLEQIEKKIQKQGNTWTCQVCNYRGPRNHKSDIMTHAEKHIEGLEYSCTMCDKTFATSVKMKAHYNSTHNVRTARVFETAEATLKVMNINIELKYKQQLEGMLECRDGLWTCVTCEFSSGSQIKKDQKRKVMEHVEKHIRGDNSCSICGKTCHTLSAMRAHCRHKHKRKLTISYV